MIDEQLNVHAACAAKICVAGKEALKKRSMADNLEIMKDEARQPSWLHIVERRPTNSASLV